jgi:hypothetical protein
MVIVLLYKPTCLCCCCVYPPAARPVVYCLLVCWVVARTRITGLFRWPAALLLVCRIGGRFVYTCFPNSSFRCFFCMVLLIAVCFLWFHIRACCLVCVPHMLMSGYYFLCTLCVLCVLLWLVCQIVLHNSVRLCCILFHISHLGFCYLFFAPVLDIWYY